jgi:Right handed beta helix region
MFYRICKMSVSIAVTAWLVAVALTTAASALETILYVSTAGSNSNPCTLAQPCRSLQFAVNRTPTSGEVRVLDSGFYGNNAKIQKSITISGNGHTVTLGAPITINSAGATVGLRQLVLNGENSTQHGINIVAAFSVSVEHCLIHGFTDHGIALVATSSDVFVTDTIARNNGVSGLFANGDSSTRLTVDNSRFERNGSNGISTIAIESTITRTVSSGNGGTGMTASSGSMNVTSSTAANNGTSGYGSFGARIVVESSVAHRNSLYGLEVGFGASMATISNSVFTQNDTGIRNSGGTGLTRQNNTVTDNTTTDVFGTWTPLGGT